MSTLADGVTDRERELGAIISAYNEVTDQLKQSHEQLGGEVRRLSEELARKNEELRRRERLAGLGEMAAGVAHEIRNPLGGIQLFASLLQRDLQDRPAELRMVKKISKCVGTLGTIVSDILEFGRPSRANPENVRLKELVLETIELASAKIEQSGVKVTFSEKTAGVELITDGRLLQRALLNLLNNAIEASAGSEGQKGAVSIDVDRGRDNLVSITVADDGPGLCCDYGDRIFNPFFTTKDDGVGLGLAIVHQIAEALGGSVGAANRCEGGAVFSLRLPHRMDAE